MKVGETAAQQARAAYQQVTQPAAATTPGQASTQSGAVRAPWHDSAVISAQAHRHALALQAVQAASDVRPEAVAKFSSQIKNGTYTVDEQNLATQLMKPSGI